MTRLGTITTTAAALLCLAASSASAQSAETYNVKFTKVVDNCDSGLSLTKASMTVNQSERNISVSIDSLPTLKGKAGKRGKLRAESKGKSGAMDVRYGLNGRAADGAVQAVFVAEYFQGKTPVCTQSFRVVGTSGRSAKSARNASSDLGRHVRGGWYREYHRGVHYGY